MNKQILILLSGLLLVGCTETIKVGNEKYRTGDAPGALLGSIGYVSGKGLFRGENKFERKRMPDYSKSNKQIEVLDEGTVQVDKIKDYEVGVKTNVDATIAAEAIAHGKLDGLVVGNIDLEAKYHILSIKSPDDVIQFINQNENSALKLLKDGKDKSRIVSKVIVAYDYKQSKAFNTSDSISFSDNKTMQGVKIDTLGKVIVGSNSKFKTLLFQLEFTHPA